ncbi:MAG: Gfo/Idh/MocA family protein [Victivallaceae bacterium]
MKEIDCGIIGSGVIAPTHIESYLKNETVRVKTLCDLKLEKAKELAAKYGIPETVTDYREILKDPEIDIVSVCTDHASHAEIAAAVLESGKHLICEKCLTSTDAGLDKILAAHRRHPELTASGIFQHRCEPTNQVLRQLIADGKFGRMLTASLTVACLRTDEYYLTDAWRGTWAQEGGSVLINQTVHHFDLMRYFLGEIESVSVKFDNLAHQGVIETEDTIAILLKFRSGALATVISTSASKSVTWRSNYIITGTEGYIEYTDFVPAFVEFTDQAAKAEIVERFKACKLDEALQVGKGYYGGGHPAQIADIIDAIRNGRPPYVTLEDAAATARVVVACYESGRTGKWIDVKY